MYDVRGVLKLDIYNDNLMNGDVIIIDKFVIFIYIYYMEKSII